MKIAIATDGTEVSAHFGRCQAYLVAEVRDGEVVSREVVPNPGHEPGRLPHLMQDLGVKCLIAGGRGPRARQMLADFNIEAITGAYGDLEQILARYAAGELEDMGNTCEHGG